MKISKRSVLTAVLCTLAMTSVAIAGTTWKTYQNDHYGIRLSVPDPQRCQTKEEGKVGGAYCNYGDMHVVALAYTGHLTTSELREAAYEYSEVAEKHWKKQGVSQNENGYRMAEAWSASVHGASVLALIGHSASRKISHVVFIYGKDRAWKQNRKDIARFIDNIHAI